MANFIHNGDSVDYTPSSAVAAGAVVVQGALVGVTKTPIAANTTGSLAVVGVFDFPKATGTGTAIAAGAACYWDATNQVATTTASGNTYMGKCVKAASTSDTLVRVRLNQ